jgi:hypothetical protein
MMLERTADTWRIFLVNCSLLGSERLETMVSVVLPDDPLFEPSIDAWCGWSKATLCDEVRYPKQRYGYVSVAILVRVCGAHWISRYSSQLGCGAFVSCLLQRIIGTRLE